MEIYRVHDPELAAKFADESMKGLHGDEALDLFMTDKIFLQTGVLETSKRKLAKEMGMTVWEGKHLGGSIVGFPGDLSMCLVTWGDTFPEFGELCMASVTELLEERGAVVERDHNDVMADGKKVSSWGKATTIEGWVQTAVQCSVNTDPDLIKTLCTKPQLKTPGAMSVYGITAEMIWEKIKSKSPKLN